MRRFVLAIAFFLAFVTPIAAQTTSSARGVVVAELQPTTLDLIPHEVQTVHGWFNATIQCESNYSPRPVLIEVNRRSLETEDGRALWSIDPTSVNLEPVAMGPNRFEVGKQVAFTLTANPDAVGQSGQIDFLLVRTGSNFPSNDCNMWGTSWRFEEPVYIDVSASPSDNETANSSAPNAAAPASLEPAPVIVEGGPVRGESYVPNEAFASMGAVLALFSSYGVYEWRRGRKD